MDEKHRIVRLIGKGGFGTVYLCEDKLTDESFAVKVIPKCKISTRVKQDRLATEREILATINNPFLNKSVRFEEDDEEVRFILEYIDGFPLHKCIWGYNDGTGFPESVARYFAAQIVLAVEALHSQGYMHRDVKSGNVLVSRATGNVTLIDFGMAKRIKDRTSSLCGTDYIMAPEIFSGYSYGFAADWWSVGVVIFEMICGIPPWPYQYSGDRFRKIRQVSIGIEGGSHNLKTWQNLSIDAKNLLSQLLKTDPSHRLGFAGANQIKAHPWFKEIDWNCLEQGETRASDIETLFSIDRDYRDRSPPVPIWRQASEWEEQCVSSAESIDAEMNEKYFSDF